MAPSNLLDLLKALHGAGMGLSQMIALSAMGQGPLTMTEIAEEIGITTAASTGLVDAMQAKGLVARTHSTTDRRSISVGLTEAGQEALQKIKDSIKTFR